MKQKSEKENEAWDFLEQIKHNAMFDNHTKSIENEKKWAARQMLDQQVREQRVQKGNEFEEENWVFKANYGPEETNLTT